MTTGLPLTVEVLLWGLIATAAMTTIMEAAQGLGWSRLSIPFLFGTFWTAERHAAYFLGFILFVAGGWGFALLYYGVFVSLERTSWWLGAALGGLHGVFLLVAFLPLLPRVHPRMASEDDGPTVSRRLEPPGFLGLNYGWGTPLSTLAGMIVYGAILGAFLPLPGGG
ncbi:hypothetical protein C882_3524 [Caenispirillum salinarum AK4]|uniref:Uncharacterized protein n=1 Tax=Caenispirillum salinarum AK4 TaxID=1238182 RepID=K9HN73_9PROT|nr:hypothetical protein [Caenispirillum salinarum]EKV31773.1 hypothetical protein C882_3524 [Caenispirillum salinarum AK4]